jgi:hypothetical protein
VFPTGTLTAGAVTVTGFLYNPATVFPVGAVTLPAAVTPRYRETTLVSSYVEAMLTMTTLASAVHSDKKESEIR